MELNPEHPVTDEMRDQWYKIAALLMHKFTLERVVITNEDIENLSAVDRVIVIHAHRDYIEVRLVDTATAAKLLKAEVTVDDRN